MTEYVLQTLGGVLITICLGLATWCLKMVINLKTKVAMNETATTVRQEEIDRRFNELKEEQIRLRSEANTLVKGISQDVKETNRYVKQLDDKMGSMQEDIAVLKAKQNGS